MLMKLEIKGKFLGLRRLEAVIQLENGEVHFLPILDGASKEVCLEIADKLRHAEIVVTDE